MSTTPEDRIRAQWRAWWGRTGHTRGQDVYWEPCRCVLSDRIIGMTPGEKTLEMARQWGKSCADIKRIVHGK